MANQQRQEGPSQDPEQQPDEGAELTGLKRAWWKWMRHLFHRGEHYKKALEEHVPDLDWRAKQVDGRNVVVVQKKGVKPSTEPTVIKVGGKEIVLPPGGTITITAEAAEALFGKPVLPKNSTNPKSYEEFDMTEEQFAQLLAAIKEQRSERGFWEKYGAGIGILATVIGLAVAISMLSSTINNTVAEKTAPIAENVETLTYSMNGNPETGAKGVNERLAAIEAKLPSKE